MKKVLISFNEIVEFAKCYADMADRAIKELNEWFDAQPDINDIISDAVKDGIEKAKESLIQATVLKMQTTGGENDN